MPKFSLLAAVAMVWLVLGLASGAMGIQEATRQAEPPPSAVGALPFATPFVIVQAGNTTWVQVHANSTKCPGDPLNGHGGEASGGPSASQTWCLESGIFPDSLCGSNPPWNTNCFKYLDIRNGLASPVGTNFWHIDTYRTDQRTYTGTRCLWCGSDGYWPPGQTSKLAYCGDWIRWGTPPGYANYWRCAIQLQLPESFSTAHGCTLYFDPRYDTECKYDYFYVDCWNGTAWTTLAIFNATSNDPGTGCVDYGPSPDYYGNTDINRLVNCNWQERTDQTKPAFRKVIAAGSIPANSPKFRWRFASDAGWSDQWNWGDTDGAAYVDNVWVFGDVGNRYRQDFEACAIGQTFPPYWSLCPVTNVVQGWHLKHDPDPPYEGGDNGDRTTCTLDSSWVFRARPENGFPVGSKQRAGFWYSVLSPRVPIANTGALIQYDEFICTKVGITCDYTDTQVRFHDRDNAAWCDWINMDGAVLGGGCSFWTFNWNEDVTRFYGPANDSLQFRWDLVDRSYPTDVCRGKHAGTEHLVDNVSIGFFDGSATIFTTRPIDLLHDSFLPEVDQAYNSWFDAYDPDNVAYYSHSLHPLPNYEQFYVDVSDKDGLSAVEIKASINRGATWITKAMTQDYPFDADNPSLGGGYCGTVTAGDLSPGATSWTVGSEIWYYVLATDNLSNHEYFPARANPSNPAHDGTADDCYNFTILPQFPPAYTGPKILLVSGFGYLGYTTAYDYSPCLAGVTSFPRTEEIYENMLRDAGYCYDKYDILGAAWNLEIHPIWFTDYDAVVWSTGVAPTWMFWEEAQLALRAYLADGGKVVVGGHRIAYNMASLSAGGLGADSLGGDFLAGVLGSTYLREMETAFNPGGMPFIYAKGAASVNVFGTPTSVGLDSLVLYRECPALAFMSYVQTNTSPPAGYTAQPLLHMLNPIGVPHADEAVYVEYQGRGQCVYLNFDLEDVINQKRTFCTGVTPPGTPGFNPGRYYGRVELMKAILQNLFGLIPATGGGGTTDVPPGPAVVYQWALGQNTPNPVAGITTISYEVARACDVSIKIYNSIGQLVNVVKSGRTEPGRYQASWDGTNQAGERVSSGIYFYKLESEQYSAVKKMAVVR